MSRWLHKPKSEFDEQYDSAMCHVAWPCDGLHEFQWDIMANAVYITLFTHTSRQEYVHVVAPDIPIGGHFKDWVANWLWEWSEGAEGYPE